MRHNPFAPSGCICPTTADLLRAALAGTEPGEACPVHEEPGPAPSGRTADPGERRRLLHVVVGAGLAGMPLNASADTIAAGLGMTTSTDHGPLDAA